MIYDNERRAERFICRIADLYLKDMDDESHGAL
jgi:hypothetical protein